MVSSSSLTDAIRSPRRVRKSTIWGIPKLAAIQYSSCVCNRQQKAKGGLAIFCLSDITLLQKVYHILSGVYVSTDLRGKASSRKAFLTGKIRSRWGLARHFDAAM